jgi:hypothetical protein
LALATLAGVSSAAAANSRGVEGCVEPQFITDELGTVGQPFSLSEGVTCLPPGDTFSDPVIHWGDGTSSPGAIAAQGSNGGAFSYVAVTGEHTYSQSGGFPINIEVTDNQTGATYEGGWHTAAAINPAPPSPPPPSPPAPAPGPPAPGPGTPTAYVSASGRTLTALRRSPRRAVVAVLSTTLASAQLRASVSWGDGAASDGTVTGASPTLEVIGEHRWRRAGRFTVTVTVTDTSGHVVARVVDRATVRT